MKASHFDYLVKMIEHDASADFERAMRQLLDDSEKFGAILGLGILSKAGFKQTFFGHVEGIEVNLPSFMLQEEPSVENKVQQVHPIFSTAADAFLPLRHLLERVEALLQSQLALIEELIRLDGLAHTLTKALWIGLLYFLANLK